MMTGNRIKTVLVLAAVAITGFAFNVAAEDRPLKVYILAGQSNMQGLGSVETFDYIGDDPATAPLLKEMRLASFSYARVKPTLSLSGSVEPLKIFLSGMRIGFPAWEIPVQGSFILEKIINHLIQGEMS